MKNLSLLLATILLFSCTNNQVNIKTPDTTKTDTKQVDNIIKDDIEKNNLDLTQFSKNLEIKLDNQAISGISKDKLKNTYIISNYAKIIKVDKTTNNIEFKDNDKDIDSFVGTIPNIFFKIDSKGNGYFIPGKIVIDDVSTDPATGKSKVFSNNTFSIYKIANLKITDTYNVEMETARFKSYCLSTDDCSDLYINFGGKNNSLNEFLKSQKKFIEDNNYHSDPADNSLVGNDIYIKMDNGISTLYTYINGVEKKTEISTISSNNMNLNIDENGNGYVLYKQEDKNKYSKIQNYLIGDIKDLNKPVDDDTYGRINYSLYSNINEQGTGFLINNNIFFKINDFKINDNTSYLLDQNLKGSKRNASIDSYGNGYLAFNVYKGLGSTGLRSVHTSKIFLLRNYNLIY